MARNEIDKFDVAAVVLFPIAAASVFGVWSLTVSIFGGWSPSQTLFSAGGTAITWALLVAILSMAWIVGTNEIDGSNYRDWEYGMIAFGFLSVPLYQFVPAFKNIVDSHDAIRVLMFLLTAVAATYIAYRD